MVGTLIGRGGELQRLRMFPSGLRDGEPRIALVSGEAGVGKSRLVTAAVDAWRDSGVQVLVGNALDLPTAGPPYAAIITALRDGPSRVVADALDTLTGAVPRPRGQLFGLLADVVTRLATRTPTVFVVEDLHWADGATRDVLLYLLAAVRSGRWGLVGTYRDTEVRTRPGLRDLVEQLGRAPDTERVGLEPLERRDVGRLMEQLTGTPPDPGTRDRIHRRSDGVPLLVEELVDADARGVIGVPPHLRDVFLARLDDVSDAAVEVIRLAAVAGHCSEETLAAAAARDPGSMTVVLEEAVDTGCLVVTRDGYGFRHELLREAVYDALVPARRRELHLALARTLTADPAADPGVVSRHWYEAGEFQRAGERALAAAAAADRVHAHGAALAGLERVLGVWDHLPATTREAAGGRGSVLARAAQAAFLAGQSPRAIVLAGEATEHADPADRAGRLERLARYHWSVGNGTEAEETYRRAMEELSPETPPAIRVQVLSGYVWLLGVTNRHEVARPIADAALDAARESGAPLDRCRALLARGACLADLEAAHAVAEESGDLAAELEADDEIALANVLLYNTALSMGDDTRALEAAHEGGELARQRNMEGGYRLVFVANEASLLIDHGRWDEAQDLLTEVDGVQEESLAGQFVLAQRMRLTAARGDAETVLAEAERILEVGSGAPQQPFPRVHVLLAGAEQLLWSGQPQDAMAMVGTAEDLIPRDAHWPELGAAINATAARASADLAQAAREAGSTHDVDRLAGDVAQRLSTIQADDHADEASSSGDRARVAAHAALATAELARLRGTRDPTSWEAAIRAWMALDRPYETAYARWRRAEVLLQDRSGRGEARQLLDEALTTAEALGAVPLATAVRTLAARARLRVGDEEPTPDAADAAARDIGLTPREHEVLRLVALGRTNAEVGATLHISPRTVGVHVSRLLRKLGASRRTEAAELARRKGLLDA